MISSFDLDKALYNQAKVIADANTYLLIPSGKAYASNPNDAYIKEAVIYGDDTPTGMEDGSDDLQIGIYQLTILAPKSNEGAKWQALQIGNVFKLGFARGLELIFNAQMVRMRSSSLIRLPDDDTHIVYALSITFSVIN